MKHDKILRIVEDFPFEVVTDINDLKQLSPDNDRERYPCPQCGWRFENLLHMRPSDIISVKRYLDVYHKVGQKPMWQKHFREKLVQSLLEMKHLLQEKLGDGILKDFGRIEDYLKGG